MLPAEHLDVPSLRINASTVHFEVAHVPSREPGVPEDLAHVGPRFPGAFAQSGLRGTRSCAPGRGFAPTRT
jgi:hypothetical protein